MWCSLLYSTHAAKPSLCCAPSLFTCGGELFSVLERCWQQILLSPLISGETGERLFVWQLVFQKNTCLLSGSTFKDQDFLKVKIKLTRINCWWLQPIQISVLHCTLLAECCITVVLTCEMIIHLLSPLFVFLQNCLIRVTSRGREALVTDFGLAREVVELPVKDPGRKLSLVGSAFWMAPEMLRGEPYDRKVVDQLLFVLLKVLPCKNYHVKEWLWNL